MCFPLPLFLVLLQPAERKRPKLLFVMLSALISSISSFRRRQLLWVQSLESIATLTSDLLELPFLGELLIQSLQLLDQVSTSSDDGVFGSE
jgi:hypothetical protein